MLTTEGNENIKVVITHFNVAPILASDLQPSVNKEETSGKILLSTSHR